MGVHGLAPFLQKVCPDVIRELPNRFQALRGKTVALDATLITTRFHFSNIPHERRHILGWHRLLSELRQNNVSVICVFDGKYRIVAKRVENTRRQGLRDLALARSDIEQLRTRRLRNLESLLPQFSQDSHHLAAQLGEIARASITPHGSARGEGSEYTKPRTRPFRARERIRLPEYDTGELFTARDDSAALSNRSREDGVGATENSQLAESFKNPFTEKPVISHSPEDLADHLRTLYNSYSEEVDLLATEEPVVPGNMRGLDINSDIEGTELAVSLTRSQREVAEGERNVWTALSKGNELSELAPGLSDLANRSELISRSYRRTAELPSENTFVESKVMIEAMGVPWIESEPDFEAEAVASSLVLHGLADYVGSEDTDVLVYQAPLLRNITSQSGPLILIFGSEIPQKLAISTSSFVDFAILVGTDFSPRLQGLGPHRALKLIRSYGNLEDVLEAAKPRYSPEPRHSPADYLERARTARHIFTTLPSAPSLEILTAKSNYDGKLIAEILAQYNLTHLAERMNQDKSKMSHTFEQDYYQSTLSSGGLD